MLDALVANGSPAALAEFRDERGVWNGASGVAELNSARPVDPHGWFRLGSVTKTFTAIVVLQLACEGRLSLADTIERWLPGVVSGGGRITLHHLLAHTSGLHDYTHDLTPAGVVRDRYKQWDPWEIVIPAVKQEPEFDPGTAWAYCNTNYILLGLVIEKASGFTYEEMVSQRILRPLDLSHTLLPTDAEALPEPHAHGYLDVDGQLVDISTINASQAGAAGGMASTARDINHFFGTLLTGGLLGQSESEIMRTTIPMASPGVGSGLSLARVDLPNGITVWGKTGGAFGYHMLSFHTADATRQLTVSMTMTASVRPATHQLLASVANVFEPPGWSTWSR
ncbi:serine hydrolase [Rhizocola hellebori]|uniref:Serine hydrolase n=2 Tax=Rhizocola hellebori TaxID=1392758 RepID=A0A8J3QHF0_9ACTN|nr:serine hydrolase [Rhizocola hellebori]